MGGKRPLAERTSKIGALTWWYLRGGVSHRHRYGVVSDTGNDPYRCPSNSGMDLRTAVCVTPETMTTGVTQTAERVTITAPPWLAG